MKLVGKLEDLGLGEILQIISFSRKSGVLWINGKVNSGYIVFKDGMIMRGSSTLVKRGLAAALVKAEVLTKDDLLKVREVQKEGGYTENLGALLMKNYSISAEVVEEEAKKIIEKAVYSFFRSHEGSFIFELKEFEETPEVLSKDKVQYSLESGINPQFLAMEGARLSDEASRDGVKDGVDEDEDDTDVGDVTFDVVDEPATAETVPETTAGTVGNTTTVAADDSQSLTGDFLRELEADGLVSAPTEHGEELTESKGLMLLKEMLEELSRPLTMSEIVLLVLRFSSEIMTRAVVFSIKKGNVVGLGQFGIELDGANPDVMVRKMKIPLGESSVLAEAIETKSRVSREMEHTEWNDYIVNQLGGTQPVESFVAPVVVRGKVAIVLYADNVPDMVEVGDTSSLEIFLAQASMALERIVLRKRLSNEKTHS